MKIISQKHNFCWIYFWYMFCDILETKRNSMEIFNRKIHCAAALVAKNDYSRFSHRTAWGKKEKSWDFSPDDFWWKKRHLHRVYIRIGRHFQFSWIASLSEEDIQTMLNLWYCMYVVHIWSIKLTIDLKGESGWPGQKKLVLLQSRRNRNGGKGAILLPKGWQIR